MRADGVEDAAGMRAMFAARAAIAGDVALYFSGPGTYSAASAAPGASGSVVIDGLVGGTLIYGDGPASLIRWIGVTKGGNVDVPLSSTQQLWSARTVSRLLIRDLAIEGENDPFVAYVSNQSSAIAVGYPGGTLAATDVMVRDVTFRTLVGFPYISRGGGDARVHAIRNAFDRCANGLNTNADFSIHWRNIYLETESDEYAGNPGLLALQDLQNGAISAGGFNTPNTEKPGTLVVGCSLKASTANVALLTAQSYTDGWLQGNVIEEAAHDAIDVGAGCSNFLFDRCAVVDNIINQATRGIGLQCGQEHVLAENSVTVGPTSDSGFATGARTGTLLIDNALGGTFDITSSCSGLAAIGNTFPAGDEFRVASGGQAPAVATRPTGASVKLFGDVGQGFATLQVLNWDRAPFVSVTLGGIGLAPGDAYHILHPYHLLDAVYQSGVYTGDPIQLAMRPVPPPTDWPVSTTGPLPTLGPRFNAFLIVKTGHESLLDYNPGARIHFAGGHFINLLFTLFGRRARQALAT